MADTPEPQADKEPRETKKNALESWGAAIWQKKSRELTAELQKRVEAGDTAHVRILLKKHLNKAFAGRFDWHKPDVGADEGKALITACKKGHAGIVHLLLDAGARPSGQIQTTSYGGPLRAAAAAGNLEIVKLLLDRKADVKAVAGGWSSDRMSALDTAVINGHADIVDYLLDHKAKPDWHTTEYAVKSGSADVVGALLKHGYAIESHRMVDAAQAGHTKTVAMLLDKGGVKANTRNGAEALYAAAAAGNAEMALKLIENGAYHGHALTAAAEVGCDAVVTKLLEIGAKPNAPADNRPLQNAVASGYLQTAKLLLDAGATAMADHNHALRIAAAHGNEPMALLLLEHGADIDNAIAHATTQDTTGYLKRLKKRDTIEWSQLDDNTVQQTKYIGMNTTLKTIFNFEAGQVVTSVLHEKGTGLTAPVSSQSVQAIAEVPQQAVVEEAKTYLAANANVDSKSRPAKRPAPGSGA